MAVTLQLLQYFTPGREIDVFVDAISESKGILLAKFGLIVTLMLQRMRSGN